VLSPYKTLLLDDSREFDSYLEEREILQENVVKDAIRVADKTAGLIKKAVNSLHSTKEENLVDNMPELSKLITRAIIVRASFAVHPAIGVITLFTTLALKSHNDKKEREKLKNLYSAKLEFIEGKLNSVENDDEKLNLLKMRNKLRTDLEKIKRIQDRKGEHLGE
jgi:hypothetical protein